MFFRKKFRILIDMCTLIFMFVNVYVYVGIMKDDYTFLSREYDMEKIFQVFCLLIILLVSPS